MVTLAQGRERRVGQAAASAAGAQVIVTCASLVLVPLLLSGIGISGYGLYATLMTVPMLLAASDFGIGTSVISRVSSSLSRDDLTSARRVISNALAALLLAACITLCLGLLLIPVGLHYLENTSTTVSRHELMLGLLVLIAFIVLGIPGALGARVVMGQQHGWVLGVQSSVAAGVSVVLALSVLQWRPSLPLAIITTLGATTSCSLGLTLLLFSKYSPELRPRMRYVSLEGLRDAARSGGLFFCLNIAGAISFQADMILIAVMLSGNEAAVYAVASRLFCLGPLAASFILTPLWPAFASALGEGDYAWVKRTFWKSIAMALMVNGAWMLICLLIGGRLISLWTRGAVPAIPLSLMISLAGWILLNSVVGPLSVLLNSAHIVKPQLLGALLMTGINLPTSIWLTELLGVSGPIWGSVIGQLTAMIPVSIWAVRRLFKASKTSGVA